MTTPRAVKTLTPAWLGPLFLVILAALGYFLSARVGYVYALPGGLVVVWPASGFMLACLLLAPPRQWPFLLAGGVLGNVAADVLAGLSLDVGIAGSLANLLEVWLAAWVVSRLGGHPFKLTTLRQAAALVVGGAIVSNALTAFVGSAVLVRGSHMPPVNAWLVWWIGDGLGMLAVAPVIIGVSALLRTPSIIARRTLIEGGLALIALCIVSNAVLGRTPAPQGRLMVDPYVLLPLLFVVAVRFRTSGAAIASLVICATTIWHASLGQGAFAGAGDSATSQAVRIYVFLATVSLTALFASAMLSERERAYSQGRLQAAALGAAANAIIITDRAGVVQWANQAFADLTGYSVVEVVGKNPSALVRSGQHDDAFYRDLWATILSGHVWRGEIINRRKDHSLYTQELAITPVPNALGEIRHFIAVQQDITERKRTERQIEILARAIESTNEMVSVTDLEDRFVFVNRAFLHVYGYQKDEVIGRTPEILQAGSRAPEQLAEILRASRGDGWHGELVNRRKDGTELAVRLGTSCIRDPHGVAVGLLGVARDITDEKRSAEALRQSEERMNLALEAAQAGTWVHDLASNVISVSGSPDRLRGVASRNPHTLDDFLKSIHPDDRESVERTIGVQHASADRFDFEFREVWPDTSVHWVRARGRVIRDGEGQPVRVLGVDLDITERKELEEQLRQVQKVEAVGQLAGGLAHDFNNLLTAILGYAKILEEGFAADDPRRLDAHEIATAGARASVLTRQLLAFSRKQILQPVVLSLNEAIEGICRMLGPMTGDHISLELNLDSRLARIKADRGQIEQALVNLVVNACDAMEQGGTVTIESANVDLDEVAAARVNAPAGGPYVRLSVRDTGIGMAPDTARRIFEPFFTTKPVGKGTGMGLAMVFGIVKQSGGAVTVDSKLGEGTTFDVYLPQTPDEPAAPIAAGPAVVERQDSQTVCVVDDDPGVLKLAVVILKREGYTVLSAKDPQAAVALLATSGAVDLLLTDVVMPGMDGPTLFGEVRQTRPGLRVLYMSGYADEAVVRRGVFAPGTHFIPKPFVRETLLSKVREALAGPV